MWMDWVYLVVALPPFFWGAEWVSESDWLTDTDRHMHCPTAWRANCPLCWFPSQPPRITLFRLSTKLFIYLGVCISLQLTEVWDLCHITHLHVVKSGGVLFTCRLFSVTTFIPAHSFLHQNYKNSPRMFHESQVDPPYNVFHTWICAGFYARLIKEVYRNSHPHGQRKTKP